MSKGNGDAVQLNIGGGLVRKLLPYLIGGGVLGGGAGLKAYHDNELEKLKSEQRSISQKVDQLDGKVELVIQLLREKRER